jgi:tyrosyl-tRNA synthetase
MTVAEQNEIRRLLQSHIFAAREAREHAKSAEVRAQCFGEWQALVTIADAIERLFQKGDANQLRGISP